MTTELRRAAHGNNIQLPATDSYGRYHQQLGLSYNQLWKEHEPVARAHVVATGALEACHLSMFPTPQVIQAPQMDSMGQMMQEMLDHHPTLPGNLVNNQPTITNLRYPFCLTARAWIAPSWPPSTPLAPMPRDYIMAHHGQKDTNILPDLDHIELHCS